MYAPHVPSNMSYRDSRMRDAQRPPVSAMPYLPPPPDTTAGLPPSRTYYGNGNRGTPPLPPSSSNMGGNIGPSNGYPSQFSRTMSGLSGSMGYGSMSRSLMSPPENIRPFSGNAMSSPEEMGSLMGNMEYASESKEQVVRYSLGNAGSYTRSVVSPPENGYLARGDRTPSAENVLMSSSRDIMPVHENGFSLRDSVSPPDNGYLSHRDRTPSTERILMSSSRNTMAVRENGNFLRTAAPPPNSGLMSLSVAPFPGDGHMSRAMEPSYEDRRTSRHRHMLSPPENEQMSTGKLAPLEENGFTSRNMDHGTEWPDNIRSVSRKMVSPFENTGAVSRNIRQVSSGGMGSMSLTMGSSAEVPSLVSSPDKVQSTSPSPPPALVSRAVPSQSSPTKRRHANKAASKASKAVTPYKGRMKNLKNMSRFMDKLLQTGVVVCDMCREVYTEPKLLDCSHTFCQACVERHCSDRKFVRELLCPTCEQPTGIPPEGVKAITTNKYVGDVARYLNAMKRRDKPFLCDLCIEYNNSKGGTAKPAAEATFHCMECSQNMCDRCCKSHRVGLQTKADLVIGMKEFLMGDFQKYNQMRIKYIQCPVHPKKQVEIACLVCQKGICLMCKLSTECENHKCTTIEQAAAGDRNELRKVVEDADDIERNCKEVVDRMKAHRAVINRNKQQLQNKLQEEEDQLHIIIKQAFDKLRDSIDYKTTDNESKYEELEREYTYKQATASGIGKVAAQLLNCGKDIEVVCYRDEILDRVPVLEDVDSIDPPEIGAGLTVTGLEGMTSVLREELRTASIGMEGGGDWKRRSTRTPAAPKRESRSAVREIVAAPQTDHTVEAAPVEPRESRLRSRSRPRSQSRGRSSRRERDPSNPRKSRSRRGSPTGSVKSVPPKMFGSGFTPEDDSRRSKKGMAPARSDYDLNNGERSSRRDRSRGDRSRGGDKWDDEFENGDKADGGGDALSELESAQLVRDVHLPCKVYGIDVDTSDNILLATIGNGLKVIDPTGKELASVLQGVICYDVVVMDDGKIAVTCDKNTVRVRTSFLKVYSEFKVAEADCLWGITCNRKNQLVVTDYGHGQSGPKSSRLYICDTKGGLLKTLNVGAGGLYNVTRVPIADRDVFILSYKYDGVIEAVTSEGKVIWRFDGHKGGNPGDPQGVCCDSRGNVFVAHSKSDKVSLLSPEGKFVKFIVSKNDGLEKVWSLIVNSTGQLVVNENSTQLIKVFDLTYTSNEI